MSSFGDNENLDETGFVSYIITIFGDGEFFRYTNSDVALNDSDGNVYDPVPFESDNIKSDSAMIGQEITVTLPVSVGVYSKFFPEPEPKIYSIIIKQAHHEDDVIEDSRLLFTGVIVSALSSGDSTSIKLKCNTQQGLLSRSGLRRRYQIQCPFMVYHSDCKADKGFSSFSVNIEPAPAFEFRFVIIRLTPDDPSEPGIWRGLDISTPQSRVFLLGSTIVFKGEEYTISGFGTYSSQNPPNFIRLRIKDYNTNGIYEAISSTPIQERIATIIPSCDHTVETCQKVFSNGQNYGGMPWIPFKNPTKQMFVGGGK